MNLEPHPKYEKILAQALSLDREARVKLMAELTARMSDEEFASVLRSKPRSIMELQGLGKEIWEGLEAQRYVNQERASWAANKD